MDLQDFTRAAGAFLAANAGPRGDVERAAPLAEARAFQRHLHDAGLAGLTWPTEVGGRGLPAAYDRAFDDIAQDYDVPTSVLTLALRICGPAVVEFGTPEQRRRHALPTLRGEQVWCQLWSEPDAGSDLGAVRTGARRTADGWRIRGHKIWTSLAHQADFALLLARTDPDAPKHRGVSMFVVPMASAGIRVEPLQQITREADFNEVWLDDVVLPADALLGREGQGWDVVTWMMARERTSVGVTMRSPKTLSWSQVRQLAVDRGLLDDPHLRRRLVELRSLHRAADALRLRVVQEIEAGTASPALGSVTKLVEGALLADAADLAAEIVGESGVAWLPGSVPGPEVADAQLKAPSFAIGGGTTEIQLNTLAEQVLGLPREPRLPVRAPRTDSND